MTLQKNLMVQKGKLITREDAQNFFFSSFEGKYVIMDNLDEKQDPIIRPREKIYNTEYVYVTVVLRGTLHLTINGTELDIKANEHLVVTPYMSVTVKESRCTFFCFLVRSYIMAEIHERTNTLKHIPFYAFNFRHRHFTQEQTDTMLECYLRIKREHTRDDYPMKEIQLRALQTAYIAKLCSFMSSSTVINHIKNSRQHKFFNDFISKLSEKHKQERSVQYYASALNITPKYLSTIVLNHTGLTASQVIDCYVIYAIKQTLYTNQRNIKATSQDFNFPSQSFFGRYFKRITGISPNQYIKQHNIKSINFIENQQTKE